MRVTRECPGNPASLHQLGRRAQAVVENARDHAAALLRCRPREILFTSGATEGNNLALLGAARGLRRLHGAPPQLVASRAEHPSVLGPLRVLQQEGHPLSLAPLGPTARVEAPALLAAAGPAAIVALQWANNETGAVQPIGELAARLPAGAHFHCDGVQGFGKLALDPGLLAAHTLVLSGHKFGAPKGTGLLRVRDEAFLEPVLTGGGQQRNLRPGTESPAAAAALVVALELALREQERFAAETAQACRALWERLRAARPDVVLNGPGLSEARLPNTLSLTFPGVDGRALLLACDAGGLAVSSGAACSSGSAQPSDVLLACGLPEKLARSTLRVSFGWGQGESAGAAAAERLMAALRPLYELANP